MEKAEPLKTASFCLIKIVINLPFSHKFLNFVS